MNQSTRTLSARAITILSLVLPFGGSLLACASDDGSNAVDAQSEELRRRKRHHFCVRATCESLGKTCGQASDGCGGTLDCGTCSEVPPAPTSTTPPAPTTTTPPAPTTPPPASGWSLGQRPFVATSSWNTAIPSNAVYGSLNWPASTGYNYWVNWEGYTPAIYQGTSADPVVNVAIPDGWGYPAQTIPIRVPTGVTGAVGTDGEIILLDGTTVHNCWQFKRTSNTTATCAAYARADAVTSTGWGQKNPFLGAGIVAAGSSMLAGMLVQAETDAGEIEHALQIALDFVLQKPGAVGEAINSDGSSSTGISQEGERLALPPSMAQPAGLSPLGAKVFRAMKKYGVFNIDVAGGCSLLRAQNNAYDSATIDALRSDVNKLIPKLQRVTF